MKRQIISTITGSNYGKVDIFNSFTGKKMQSSSLGKMNIIKIESNPIDSFQLAIAVPSNNKKIYITEEYYKLILLNIKNNESNRVRKNYNSGLGLNMYFILKATNLPIYSRKVVCFQIVVTKK